VTTANSILDQLLLVLGLLPAVDRLHLDRQGVDLLGLVPQAKEAVTTILARTLDLMWALALMEKLANSTHLSALLLTMTKA